jgi:pyruvate formate lyase activating enzyme
MMILGGIQRHSMIDFPGTPACVLFVQGCNFQCPYCHNPSLVQGRSVPDDSLDQGEAIQLLKERRGFLEAVVISGGEPTLQEGLPPFCQEIKELGYAVKLDTNGSRPRMLQSLLASGTVDYIAMDIKTHPERYGPLVWSRPNAAAIQESIRLILASGIPHEFRTTCLRPLVDAPIIGQIARLIEGADLFALQQVRPGDVLDPAFCEDRSRYYDAMDLEDFRSLATPHVKRCIVR